MRAALLAVAALAVCAAAPEPPTGQWLTPEHDGVIDITRCDKGLCGVIVGLTDFKPDGRPPRDVLGVSQCHLPIITDAAPDASGVWLGHIRNPEDGHVHTIQLTVDTEDRLHLRGYLLVPLLGQTVVMTRYHGQVAPDCHMD